LLILVNLITNALRATADNVGRRQLLSVRATIEAGERMVITVADNGEGIEPQNLTRIFAPGFSTDSGGHGFGLHNSALAAKEMGGALNVRSGGAARGARFVLSVPLVA
jgi:signal transduction histidine kinase